MMTGVKRNSLTDGFLVLGLFLLAVALPMTVFLIQRNQENRSRAAEDVSGIIGDCGQSTGEYFSVKPDSGLCDKGMLLWNDESADDGDWNWVCKGDASIENSSVECIALKK